jgi:hypothetical protein
MQQKSRLKMFSSGLLVYRQMFLKVNSCNSCTVKVYISINRTKIRRNESVYFLQYMTDSEIRITIIRVRSILILCFSCALFPVVQTILHSAIFVPGKRNTQQKNCSPIKTTQKNLVLCCSFWWYNLAFC